MGPSPTRKPSLYYTLDYPVVDRDKKDYNSGLIGDSRAIPPPSFDINDCEHKRLNGGRSTNDTREKPPGLSHRRSCFREIARDWVIEIFFRILLLKFRGTLRVPPFQGGESRKPTGLPWKNCAFRLKTF